MTGMRVGQGTTFDQLYTGLSKSDLKSSHHVRGSNVDETGTTIYKHTALLSRSGADALRERQQKFADGAQAIRQAIANQTSPAFADRVLRNVGQAKGRDMD